VRRSAVGLAVVLVAAVGLAGCGGGKPKLSGGGSGDGNKVNTVEQGRALKTVNGGQLTACVHLPKPPLAYQEAGDTKGLDVDLVRAITGRLGLGAAFRDLPADQLLGALGSGQCDVVASGVIVTDGLKKQYDVSDGYFDVYQALAVRPADSGAYKDLAALKGKKVAVVASSAGADYVAKNGSGVTAVPFPDADAALGALTGGKVDAAVVDSPAAAYAAKSGGQVALAKVFTDGAAQHYGFVMAKGKDALQAAVNNALREVRSDDSYRMIVTNYLGTTAGQG
jgi:ABC-type amino acid transport substrate-binding protein